MKIALIGYGKMGKAIESICLSKKHEVVLKIDIENKSDFTLSNLRQADVAIEFTSPETAPGNIITCLEAGVPIVCGTTGWLQHLDKIKNVCTEKNGAFLYSSNFSIGVNIFFEINDRLAELMSGHPEYDISIEEIHHTQKKDSPSGTAITLAEEVLKVSKSKKKWLNAISNEPSDLVISSKRIDPAAGTHSVKYSSKIDDIEIIHTAHSRLGFAMGAVLAAEFIVGKKGIFGMKEVLGM